MISSISSLEIIKFVNPDPNIFLWIVASVADAVAVNLNGIKMLLANGFSIFPIKDNPFLKNVPKSLSKNPCDSRFLCNWAFESFILAEELFAKVLRSFEIYVLVNNILGGKLFSSLDSPITTDERCKVSSSILCCKF